MPTLIYLMNEAIRGCVDADADGRAHRWLAEMVEFSTVAVYTCEASCTVPVIPGDTESVEDGPEGGGLDESGIFNEGVLALMLDTEL